MTKNVPPKASGKRKKPKDSKTSDQKQVLSDSKAISGALENDVDQHDQGTTVYGRGDFHRRICFFALITVIVLVCHNLSFALVTPPVDHWCRPPPRFTDLSASQWKNIGIPVDEEGRPSECLAYAQPGQQPNDTEAYECDAWDYDPTRARQSANLVCRWSWLLSLGNAAYMTGALLVVPLAGYLADKLGRMTLINSGIVVLLASTGATCISRAYPFFLGVKFVNSACASSTCIVSLILPYEVAPLSHRAFYISVSCAGGIFLGGLLIFILASLPVSWPVLQVIVLSPTALLLLSTYAVEESPACLLAASRVDDTQAVMFKAATMNNMNRLLAKQTMQKVRLEYSRAEGSPYTSGFTVSSPDAIQARRPHIIRVLILVFTMMLGVFTLYWARRLRKRTTLSVVSLTMSAPSYVVMYLALISLGRLQYLIVVMALLGGASSVCSIAFYANPRLVGDVVLVFAHNCARVLVPSACLYIAELFPTSARCAALCGRLGAVAASALSLLDYAEREDLKLIIVGSALFVGVVAVLGFPETSRPLVEVCAAETEKDMLRVMRDTLESSPSPRLMRKGKANH